MDFWLKVAFLEDSAEDIFFSAQRTLKPLGVSRFTPLGVLYSMAMHPASRGRVALLTGKDCDVIASTAKQALERQISQRYSQSESGFTPAPSLETLIDKALKEAGGKINVATVDHLLLALLTMPEEQGNDAKPILKALDIKESYVREAIMKMPDGKQFFSNFSNKVLKSEEPQAELASRKKAAANLMAVLTKQTGSNVLLFGGEGSGRHGVLRQLVKDIDKKVFRNAKDWRVLELNLSLLRESPASIKTAKEELKKLPPNTIILVDEVKAQDIHLVRPFMEHPTPVILIATVTEAKKLEGQEVNLLERFPMPETTAEETRAILEVHCKNLSKYHGVDISLTGPAYEALIRYGKLVMGLELPGAAVRLLDLVAAYEKLHGDNVVDLSDVARVIAERTKVSVQALTRNEREKLLKLDEILDAQIVGQEEAKTVIRDALYSAYLGFKEKERPIGSFVFLGPTGVGKTEMARALAKFLFDSPDALIRLDMSEYQERHTVARLIGSPPGYVGYEEGGKLTEEITRKPFSIVLFDEVDKAHPEVLNILLQMLDAGRLTDGKGRTADFSHTIIICTSNHGSPLFYQAIQQKMDFGRVKKEVLEWFRNTMPPELFNRFDSVVIFDPLTRNDQAKILEILLVKLVCQPLKERHNIEVSFDESVKSMLLEKGFDAALGARPLKRIIHQQIRNPLAVKLLQEELQPGSRIRCIKKGETVEFLVEFLKEN